MVHILKYSLYVVSKLLFLTYLALKAVADWFGSVSNYSAHSVS